MKKIVIIDDSPTVCRLIEKDIKNLGAVIFKCHNGSDGINAAINEQPDIITLDIDMPGMDGYEVCHMLRNNPKTAEIPIIFISASDSTLNREKAFTSGCIEFFSKPFKQGDLYKYIKSIFEDMNSTKLGKVMVIDDNPTIRMIIKQILEKNRYEVMTLDSGKNVMSEITPEIDCIILDWVMPELSGPEIMKQIRQNDKWDGIPIIFISGIDDRKKICKVLKEGASDYIIKPFNEDEFVARISSHLKGKSYLNRLEKQKVELEELNRLKDDFLSIAAHDLRSPLSVTISGSELLLKVLKGTVSPKVLKIMEGINRQSHYLLDLINDLLDIAKIESGETEIEKQSINLNEIILKSLDTYKFLAENKNIQIKINIDKSIKVFCDESRILQVLNNLLGNALKFTEKGEIIISAQTREEEFMELCVSDTGMGIPAKDFNNIFDKFQRGTGKGSRSKGGTGLGLSICKNIIELHGGAIWVDSVKDKGSKFYFTLPIGE